MKIFEVFDVPRIGGNKPKFKPPKPPKIQKRPKSNLEFTNYLNWARDIRWEHQDAVAFENTNDEVLALTPDERSCYGIWSNKDNNGVSYHESRPTHMVTHSHKNLKKLKKDD